MFQTKSKVAQVLTLIDTFITLLAFTVIGDNSYYYDHYLLIYGNSKCIVWLQYARFLHLATIMIAYCMSPNALRATCINRRLYNFK